MDSSSAARPAGVIEFRDDDEGVSGVGRQGRRWRVLEERSGWRLSFRDPGDARDTNAGVFGTRVAAQQEAERSSAR